MRLPRPLHLSIALGGAVAPAVQWVLLGGGTREAWVLGGLTGAVTGATYSVHRVVKAARAPEELQPERRDFLQRHGAGLIAAWGAAVLAAACSFIAHAPSLVGRLMHPVPMGLAALGAAVTLGYAVLPWGGRGGGRRAAGREWPGAKLPWIALTWAALSVLGPAYLLGGPPSAWAVAAQAAFVAGITLPFDVRDLGVDAPSMRTLPQVLGPSRAIRIALCLTAFSAAGFLIADPAAGRWVVSALTLLILPFGVRPRRPFYYEIVLDGLLVAQGLALFF